MSISNRPLEQFGHIRRTRDERFPYEIASIMPGEYFVCLDEMIIYTVLGSCVSVCIRDPLLNIGGMNHFMLPKPNGNSTWEMSTRYGCYAMELLINEIMKRGGDKKRFEVKVFGGAKMYDCANDIGGYNISWITEYLNREGLRPVKADVGGTRPRKIYYFTFSGKVLMKKIERIKNQTILEREEQYQEALHKRKEEGEVVFLKSSSRKQKENPSLIMENSALRTTDFI